MKQSIVKWLFELNAKQREVLARRFGLLGYEAATLEDVGREIGLTRERVRQIQVEGLRRLREILQTQGLNIEALFRSKYPCQKGQSTDWPFFTVCLLPATAGYSAPLARHQYLFASCETLVDSVRGWYGVTVRYRAGIQTMLTLIYRPDSFTGEVAMSSICASAQRGQIIGYSLFTVGQHGGQLFSPGFSFR